MDNKRYKLSSEEINRFFKEGYLGPYDMGSTEEMKSFLEYVDACVLPNKPSFKSPNVQSRHLDHRRVYDVCTHPAILDRMADLFGDDLVLWRSNFWEKKPGEEETSWHQDANYWPIDPVINVSAWIAVTDAFIENSCVQLIPGSHRKMVPHIKNEGTGWAVMADPQHVDVSKAVPIELKAGQFFLFSEKTLHYSAPNTSDVRRMGLAVRVTLPLVKVFSEELYAGHKSILVRGVDRFQRNEMTEPPH